MTLDGRLRGAAAFLAPDYGDFGALGQVLIDDGEGDDRAFVVSVAGISGDADRLASDDHLVIGQGGIVGERKIDVLGDLAFLKERPEVAGSVVAIPDQSD